MRDVEESNNEGALSSIIMKVMWMEETTAASVNMADK